MGKPGGPSALFTVLGRETLHAGFCRIDRVRFTRPGDDRTFSYEIEDHGHAVAVLAFDPVRRLAVFVRQLRLPQALEGDEPRPFEVIAGLLDQPGEDPDGAVRREAMEEAGLELRTLVRAAAARSAPGFTTEKLTLYFAEVDLDRDRVAEGGGLWSEGEAIEIVVMPLAETARLADAGETFDLKSLVLVQTLRLKRPELFG